MSAQRSKPLSEFMGRVHFGYLITVCERAELECPTTFPGMGQRLFWPFDDPAAVEGSEEERLSAFRQVRDQIEARLTEWLAEPEGCVDEAGLAPRPAQNCRSALPGD